MRFSLTLALFSLQPDSSTQSWREESVSVNFLSQCMSGISCQGLRCRAVEGEMEFSLELLQDTVCHDSTDCREAATGLQCIKGGCECPLYQALNVSACQCQPAAQCGDECIAQHNGRRCEDEYCSCVPSPDFSSLLVDPGSLFCILPAQEAVQIYSSPGLTVLGVLGGLAAAVLLIVLGLVLRKNCTCDQGDYQCEDEPDLPELPHVAAWDHPSLDYIPRSGEEDIVFTLALAKDNVRMSNASTIHVVDEELPDYNENRGYVDDVDDPRHD